MQWNRAGKISQPVVYYTEILIICTFKTCKQPYPQIAYISVGRRTLNKCWGGGGGGTLAKIMLLSVCS